MNELLTIEGACHCGAIQVTARVDRGLVMACHCTDCQTIGGGPFRAVAICNSEHFAVEGEPKEYVKIAESGNNVSRLSAVTVEHSCMRAMSNDKNLISVLVF